MSASANSRHRGYSITSSASAGSVGVAPRLSLHSLLANTHLLVGIDQEIIEVIDPDQAEAWKFQVSNDVERCCKGGREAHHVYPAASLGSSH